MSTSSFLVQSLKHGNGCAFMTSSSQLMEKPKSNRIGPKGLDEQLSFYKHQWSQYVKLESEEAVPLCKPGEVMPEHLASPSPIPILNKPALEHLPSPSNGKDNELGSSSSSSEEGAGDQPSPTATPPVDEVPNANGHPLLVPTAAVASYPHDLEQQQQQQQRRRPAAAAPGLQSLGSPVSERDRGGDHSSLDPVMAIFRRSLSSREAVGGSGSGMLEEEAGGGYESARLMRRTSSMPSDFSDDNLADIPIAQAVGRGAEDASSAASPSPTDRSHRRVCFSNTVSVVTFQRETKLSEIKKGGGGPLPSEGQQERAEGGGTGTSPVRRHSPSSEGERRDHHGSYTSRLEVSPRSRGFRSPPSSSEQLQQDRMSVGEVFKVAAMPSRDAKGVSSSSSSSSGRAVYEPRLTVDTGASTAAAPGHHHHHHQQRERGRSRASGDDFTFLSREAAGALKPRRRRSSLDGDTFRGGEAADAAPASAMARTPDGRSGPRYGSGSGFKDLQEVQHRPLKGDCPDESDSDASLSSRGGAGGAGGRLPDLVQRRRPDGAAAAAGGGVLRKKAPSDDFYQRGEPIRVSAPRTLPDAMQLKLGKKQLELLSGKRSPERVVEGYAAKGPSRDQDAAQVIRRVSGCFQRDLSEARLSKGSR
eukprot:jgi/Mesen1/6368/ME000329S05536